MTTATTRLSRTIDQGHTPGPGILRLLTAWLGIWPSPGVLRVAPSVRRVAPGWDGRSHPFIGVAAGAGYGHAVALSVPPLRFPAVRELVDELARRGVLPDRVELGERLPAAIGTPARTYVESTLRWTMKPADTPAIGLWRPSDDPDLPAWLRPFGSRVLVAVDGDGRYLAGVGVKRHNSFAHELAVGTAPAARGHGLARALVAQAARRVLADGAVPLYRHDPHDGASGRVAEAAGFPDRGWRWLGLTDDTNDATK